MAQKNDRGLLRWMRPIPTTLCLAAVALSLSLFGCNTVDRVILAPPSIPDAEFVGSESCSECHEKYTRNFHLATHASLVTEGENPQEMGCESCHGPGSLHVQSGGAFHTILNPKRGHSIVNPRRSPDVCFRCHQDQRGRFRLPHHHPLEEGKVACSDCHDPHGGPAIRSTAFALDNTLSCTQCHTAQQGPYVFEHEAVREGCTICHSPHGSVNEKMLTERGSNLCLKCHVDMRTSNVTVGGLPHQFLMQRGTCWTAGCHEAVHGSHVSATLRY